MECSVSGGASEYLDALYEEYEGFDVQQTTVGVDHGEFDVVRGRPDGMAVRGRIRGEGGVVALPDGDGWVLPGGVTDARPDRGTVARLLEGWTGVRCSVEGLDRVSIVCLQCDDAPGELWTVSGVFSATAEGGSPRHGAVWQDRSETIAVPSL